jgi:multisubunit Na+/H+ antiporter MnhB subunit
MFNDRLGSRAVIAISAGVFAALILLRAVAPDGGVEGAVAPSCATAIWRFRCWRWRW